MTTAAIRPITTPGDVLVSCITPQAEKQLRHLPAREQARVAAVLGKPVSACRHRKLAGLDQFDVHRIRVTRFLRVTYRILPSGACVIHVGTRPEFGRFASVYNGTLPGALIPIEEVLTVKKHNPAPCTNGTPTVVTGYEASPAAADILSLLREIAKPVVAEQTDPLLVYQLQLGERLDTLGVTVGALAETVDAKLTSAALALGEVDVVRDECRTAVRDALEQVLDRCEAAIREAATEQQAGLDQLRGVFESALKTFEGEQVAAIRAHAQKLAAQLASVVAEVADLREMVRGIAGQITELRGTIQTLLSAVARTHNRLTGLERAHAETQADLAATKAELARLKEEIERRRLGARLARAIRWVRSRCRLGAAA